MSFDLQILGTESLGVRGLSCFVQTENRSYLIDPGAALGFIRQGHLPHPLQVAAGEKTQRKILKCLPNTTDIIISHFHGDHIPLQNANPYQLPLYIVIPGFSGKRLWMKPIENEPPHIKERKIHLSRVDGVKECLIQNARNKELAFSHPVCHGRSESPMGNVMMTRIQTEEEVFVHASDIQLLSDDPLPLIEKWSPDVLLLSGPPVYRHLSSVQMADARKRALRLSESCKKACIIDHHLLRCEKGIAWLERIKKETSGRIMCAADYMGKTPLYFEAERLELYKRFPVERHWHNRYSQAFTEVS